MPSITAVILTKNEQKNLPECLSSLAGFASRVIVVDSGSADDTVNIAKNMGADVYTHEFECYARQFNWALDNIQIDTDWTMRFDADERMTGAARAEALAVMRDAEADPSITGIVMEATFFMLGKPLKHAGTQKRKIILFKTGAGRIEDRYMDEHTVLLTGKAVPISAKFEHHDFKSIDHFAKKLNWYASREVLDVLEQSAPEGGFKDEKLSGMRRKKFGLYYKAPMFLRAFCLFVFRYVIKLGFLDGREGLIYHFMYSYMYRFLVDAKLYEAKKNGADYTVLKALED